MLNGNACLSSNESNGIAPLREFILEPGNLWDQPRPQLIANMRASGAADAFCMLRCRLQLQLRAACPVNCNRTLATPPHPGARNQRLHRRNVAHTHTHRPPRSWLTPTRRLSWRCATRWRATPTTARCGAHSLLLALLRCTLALPARAAAALSDAMADERLMRWRCRRQCSLLERRWCAS